MICIQTVIRRQLMGSKIANRTVNNHQRMEEEDLAWISIIASIRWPHWKPRKISRCPQKLNQRQKIANGFQDCCNTNKGLLGVFWPPGAKLKQKLRFCCILYHNKASICTITDKIFKPINVPLCQCVNNSTKQLIWFEVMQHHGGQVVSAIGRSFTKWPKTQLNDNVALTVRCGNRQLTR